MARSRLSDNFGKEWYSPQLKLTIFDDWTRLAAGPQDWLDSRLNGDTARAFVMARSRLSDNSGKVWYNPQLKLTIFDDWTKHAAGPQD